MSAPRRPHARSSSPARRDGTRSKQGSEAREVNDASPEEAVAGICEETHKVDVLATSHVAQPKVLHVR